MLSKTLAQALAKSKAADECEVASADLSECQSPSNSPPEPFVDDTYVQLESALDQLVRHARFVAGADGAALALSGPRGVVCRASCGYAPDVGVSLDPDSGVCGHCFSSGEVTLGRVQEANAVLSSVLAVPIAAGATPQGMIAVFCRSPRTFRGEHMAGLIRIADVIAEQLAGRNLSKHSSGPLMSKASPNAVIAPPSAPPASENASQTGLTPPLPAMSESAGPVVPRVAEAVGTTERTVKDVPSTDLPFAFETVTQARRNYAVPVITSVILLITFGALWGFSWRTKLIQILHTLSPAHSVTVLPPEPPPPAPVADQPQATPTPENALPTPSQDSERAPDGAHPGQSALPPARR